MPEQLDERTVGDVMTRDVLCVDADLPVSDLPAVLVARGVSGAPVLQDTKVVGVVSTVDVLLALRDGWPPAAPTPARHLTAFYLSPAALPPGVEHVAGLVPAPVATDARVRDVMTTELLTVAPSDPLPTAARRMLERRVHRLLVVDGLRLVGLVSALDLLAGLAARPAAPPLESPTSTTCDSG